MTEDLRTAIQQLRDRCNREIREINAVGAQRVPNFDRINSLLRACDRVFAAADAEKQA